MNLSAGFGNVDTAIRGLKGFTSGTSAARVVGVQLYNLMESEAASQGTIAQFNANKTAIRNAIARQVGVAQVATDIGAGNAGERIEQAKSGRRQELMAKIGGDTVDQTEINKLKKQAGMDPTPTSGTTGGKGPSATSLEQEELMASRLTGIQNKMTQLEDSIMEKSTAEAMLKRQREIYQNQYGKKKGSSRAARKAIKNMTPEQRFLFDAIKSSADSTFNPYNYVPEADGSDGGSVNFKAKELMDAIIANRGSGETIDVAGMAAKMDPENAEKIVGLALRGVVTYAKQADPLTETKEKVDVETTLDALEDVVVEKLGQEEIKREELKDAEAKAEAPVDTATPEAMEQGLITPFDQAPKAFSSEEDITNFLRTRTGVPTERVQEILGDRVTEAQAKRITEITTPPTNEELSEVRLAGPKFGEIYFKDPKNPTFGYKFIDDQTVQFVKKDGTVIQKKFGADTPQYTEAVKYYELSKQK